MELFKVKDLYFVAGVEWKEISGGTERSIKRKIKKEELSRDRDYFHAVYLDIFKDNKKTLYASVSNNKLFFTNKIYAGASVFVNSLRGYVFIKKLKEYKEGGINKTLYWFLVIDDDGFVVEDEAINDDMVEGKIAEYVEILYKVAIYKNDYKIYSNDISVDKIINEAFFYIDDKSAPTSLFTYYKREDYTTIYKYVFVLGLMGIFGGVFFTMYESEEKTQLAVYNYKSLIEHKVNLVDNWLKLQAPVNRRGGSKSGTPSYTQEEFYDFGKKQVQTIFDAQRYENETILSNIIEIEQTIPLYLAEWKFSSLSYIGNEFIITFDKIPNSNGVFTEIDYIMEKYDDEYSFEIIPYSLENSASKRVYLVKFSNYKQSGDNDEYITLYEWREKQRNSIDEIMAEIKKSENKINSIKSRVSKLSAFEQVFTNKIPIAKMEIENEVNFLSKLYDEALLEINKQPENYQMNFNLEKLTRMRYVEKIQINTDYQWVYPDDGVSYPNIKQDGLKYYADSYKVGAASIEGFSNNFEALLDAGEQLTGMNTIIHTVNYGIETGEWVIMGELFELSSNIEKPKK